MLVEKSGHPVKINILKSSVDFYAINIFITCESNFRYLILISHKSAGTVVFNLQFYEPLRFVTLSWKSMTFFGDNLCFVVLWTDLAGSTYLTFVTYDK